MFELLAFGFLALVALFVVGVLLAGFQLVFWVLFLPLRILGWGFHALGLLVALPILAVLGIVGFVVFGVGAFVFLLPILPLVLIALLAWVLLRRRSGHRAGA